VVRPLSRRDPDLIELQNAYPNDVAVLGVVVMDRFGTHVKQFASEFPINYPVLDATSRTDVEDAYAPMWGLPTTILIERGGNVTIRLSRSGSKEQFERDVKPVP